MTTCVMGCTLTGQHVSTCTDGECRGCLPRPAETGLLCAWHVNRVTQAVEGFESLHAWLMVVDDDDDSTAAKPYGENRAQGDPAETVPIPASRLVADELWNDLLGWARVVLEEHAPALKGWDHAGMSMPQWFALRLPWVFEQMWVDELVRVWMRDCQTARFRWPTVDDVEPARKVSVPCPRCGMLSLLYTPPRYERQAFRVECTDPDCARVFAEDEWERFKALSMMGGRG